MITISTYLRDIKQTLSAFVPFHAKALHCTYKAYKINHQCDFMYADRQARWREVEDEDLLSLGLMRSMLTLANAISPSKGAPFQLDLTFDSHSPRSVVTYRRFNRNIIKNSGEYIIDLIQRGQNERVTLTREAEPDWHNARPTLVQRHVVTGQRAPVLPVKQPYRQLKPRARQAGLQSS